MIEPGSLVRVLPPFDAHYPDTYAVLGVGEDGTVRVDLPGYAVLDADGRDTGDGGATFAPEFVEEAPT